jgi:magnesium transporter
MENIYSLQNGKIALCPEANGPIKMYVNPDEAERRRLVAEDGLDEHTIFSALDPDELSRLEHGSDHLALIVKRPSLNRGQDRFLFKVSSTGIFVFPDRMIIISAEPLKLEETKEYRDCASLHTLMLRLVYKAIIHFREHLKVINMISDELQVKIARAMENRVLLNMFSIQKSLEYYLQAINSNVHLLEKLRLNAARIGFTPEQLEMLDDITIENNQCLKQAEIYANVLASLMDARASIVGNNLNVMMKTLNLVMVSLMVPNLVISIFSMNVDLPLAHHPWGFYVVMLMSLLSLGVAVILWRKQKW